VEIVLVAPVTDAVALVLVLDDEREPDVVAVGVKLMGLR
jgi:hypothetical protein